MSDIEENVGNIAINSRQDNTRSMQQKAAYEDRLKAIKNKNADPLFLKNSKNHKAAPIDNYVVFRDKNVGSVWVETLNEKKRQEQTKIIPPTPQLEKRQQYSYQKKQVLLQEHFDTQTKPSLQESDELFAAARLLCNEFDPNRNQDLYSIHSLHETFPIGDTQIYSVSTLDSNATVRVHRALSQNSSSSGFIPLQCGVYRDELDDTHSISDLRAVAIAFRLNARHCFIALSLRQGNISVDVNRLLGPRKVVVMSAAGQYSIGDNKRLFDRVVNVTPAVVRTPQHEKLQISTDDVFVRNDGRSVNNNSAASSNRKPTTASSSPRRAVNSPPKESKQTDEPEYTATAYDERAGNSDDGYGYRPGDTSDEESQGEDEVDRSPYFRSEKNATPSRIPAVSQGRYFEDTRQDQQHQQQNIPRASPAQSNNRNPTAPSGEQMHRGRSRSRSRDSRSSYSRSRSRSSGGRSYNSSYYSDDSYDRNGGEGRREEPPHYGHQEDEEDLDDPECWQTHFSSSKQDLLDGAPTLLVDEDDEPLHIITTRSGKSGFSNPNSIASASAKSTFNPRSQTPLVQPNSLHSTSNTSPNRQCGGVQVVDESYWRVASRGVAGPVSVVMSLDVSDVISLHCSSNLLVLEGRDSSTLFTGTLKSASSSSKYVISSDKVFQWTRGVYMRGWLAKWPSNSQQKLVRPTQRYFVLKDRSLSYHKEELREGDEDDQIGAAAGKVFALDADSQVKTGVHNMQHCIKVKSATSKLWVAVTDGADEDERRWVDELRKAVQTSSSPTPNSQPLVQFSTRWYHESTRMSILSVDAIAAPGGFGFTRVALFELCGLTGTPKGRLFSSSGADKPRRGSGGFSSRAGELMHNSYFVEIGTESLEKLKLPVVLTNESPALPSDLSVVKVFGSDMVILGGSGGFLGVGAVGRTTGVALGKVRKVVYCVICRPPVVKSSSSTSAAKGAAVVYPHSDHSVVTTIACGVTATVFAAADSEGVVSLWFLDREDEALRLSQSPSKTNLAFYYKIKPALQSSLNISSLCDQNLSTDVWGGERVLSMQFLCDDRYLAVSTTQRLLLLLVASGSEGMTSVSILPYRFAGWVEVDRVLVRQSTGLFGLHVEEQEVFVPGSGSGKNKKVATKVTYWRALQSSVEESSSSDNKSNGSQKGGIVRYTVSKFEWSSAMLISILNQMQPL